MHMFHIILMGTIGLKICEIDGIKRISRKEIDRFLEEHSS